MKNVKQIFRMLLPDSQQDLAVTANEAATFILSYGNLKVATLSLKDGLWKFVYSNEFKAQNEVKPLIEFSDVDKVYTTTMLWPFFTIRIPGLKRPSVQRKIKEQSINKDSFVDMLKNFGKRTIANPYELNYV